MIQRDDTERLHVLTGAYCNNNCTFCMEDDRDWRAVRNGSITPEVVRDMLQRHRGRGEVIFTSGEPTLNPNLLRYLFWTRQLGYERRGVITNGRRFSDLDYARRAVRAGLNHVVVSIHGGDAKLHDSLVRCPGAFDQTLEGIRNLSRLRETHDLVLHTSTVVQIRNHRAERLADLWALLSPCVDQIVLNVIQPWGRGETLFHRLVPRYGQIVSELGRFLRQRGSLPEGPEIFLLDIPYCLTEGLPPGVRGYVERYVHYEAEEGSHRRWAEQNDPTLGSLGTDVDISPLLRQKMEIGEACFEAEDGLKGLNRDLQNRLTREKRAECRTCRYDAVCEGVWKNYLRRHGWEEFTPVFPPAAVRTGGAT